MKIKYDLAVAYRCYSEPCKDRHPPQIYKEDKLKLAELCFRSFKAACEDLNVKLWIILTGPKEYEDMFRRVWEKELTILYTPKIGSPRTLKRQVEILTEQYDSDIVYLAEDDYLYVPGALKKAVNLMNNNIFVDFISLYNHPDNYRINYQTRNKSLFFKGDLYCNRAATTHTFLTRKEILNKYRKIFNIFMFGRYRYDLIDADTEQWLAITKQNLFNPLYFIKSLFDNRYWSFCIFLSFVYHWKQVMFGKRVDLWIPEVSMATHLGIGLEGVGTDWSKYFNNK